ncbi:DNA cytosine methyltransferase [Isoptericola sp. b515]|nr:DNA cytosine methyltransferase [Isoptericola sp. b515]MDO8147490.1 DNA cytosine methyltransferase [Isoptericola sp. b515]
MTHGGESPEPIRVLDLFAGCGGLTEGFHQFRAVPGGPPVFRTVGAVEWDTAAAATYAMNFAAGSPRVTGGATPKVYCRDIVGWDPTEELGDIDVVVGGPPCQGFSGLNRNRVRAERNTLWQEFIRVVEHVQPRIFVIENVDRFVRSPEFADLQARMGKDKLSDYRLASPTGTYSEHIDPDLARRYLLNAADYGARQARRRAIVIGVRDDGSAGAADFRYPEPTHIRSRGGFDLDVGPRRPWRTADEVFDATMRKTPTATDFDGGQELSDLAREILGRDAPAFRTGELHITRRPEPVSRARYRAIPPGGNRKDLRGRYRCTFEDGSDEVIVEKSDDFRDTNGELLVDGRYRVVENGAPGSRELNITVDAESVPPVPQSGRHRTESFRVDVKDGRHLRRAELEYLSTVVWDGHDAGSGDVMGRLRLGAPSVTIRTEFFKPEKGRYLHPTEDRPITHYEAALLQGFPEDFLWCGSKTDVAKQIGNAVPIALGTKVAEAIHAFLQA